MLRTDVKDIPHIARMQDESAGLVLGMMIVGCLVSILAILIELTSLKHLTGTPRVLHLLLTGTTLAVSWALLPTSFAMHYAHHHYLHRSQNVTPMIFPENRKNPVTGISSIFPSPSLWRHKPPMWRPVPPTCDKLRCSSP
jgi:uncharacterized membrane protein